MSRLLRFAVAVLLSELSLTSVACGPARSGTEDAAGDGESAVTTVNLRPTSDVGSHLVAGVGNQASLFQNVDDGVLFSAADDSAGYVRGEPGVASGSHTVGYSGAPAGQVSQVVVNYRAQRGSAQGTVQMTLFDGASVVGVGPAHPVDSWTNFTDVFVVSVVDANRLRTQLTFHNTSSTGALRYTQVWLTVTFGKPTAVDGGSPTDAGTPTDGGTSLPPVDAGYPAGAVVLPLEVIGPDGYTQSVEVQVADPTGVSALSLQAHHLGYTEGLSPKSGQAKASVQLNGGAWLPLTNATVTLSEPERSYGGIGGGFHTVRLTVPVTGVRAGANTLRFRFNGNDGITIGYRVLAFNLLRGSTPVLPASTFASEDPASWRAPNLSGVAAGKALWSQESSLTTPSGTHLRASCADCHAADGRDLKYFNYSNWSILQRSVFHGLSPAQGEQIASYIRSLTTPAPAAARPWNPPYQPGPGLDARPATEWAAGAGLKAVLDKDQDMLPSMAPAGSSWAALTATSSTLNLRQMPIAIQLPDWNSWLPIDHPLDAWGSTFTTGAANNAYLGLVRDLPSLSANPTRTLVTRVGDFDAGVRTFIGLGRTDATGQGPWRTLQGTTVNAVAPSIGRERAKLGLAKWMAVKTWELMQQFQLEAMPYRVLPPVNGVVHGEVRGWPSDGQSTWAAAPHMSADSKVSFTGQSPLVGYYLSSAWYQLQMTLNPAMRIATDTTPVDWAYHFRHLFLLADASKQPQPLRYIQSMIKAYQARDNGLGPTGLGWQFRFLHPWQIFSNDSGDGGGETVAMRFRGHNGKWLHNV